MSGSTRKLNAPSDSPFCFPRSLDRKPHRPQESVLYSDDLISIILENLAIDPRCVQSGFDQENYKKLRGSRKYLLDAALVCRSFSEPALDLLWRSMESLRPLLNLLPKSHLEVMDGQYVVYGPVSQALASDLFNRYAIRVRTFVHQPALYEPNRTFPVYAWLPLIAQSALVGTCILPCLHTLVISQVMNETQVIALLSSSLRRVDMDITWPSKENWPGLIALFTCLLSRAPQLQHLTYRGRMAPQLHRPLRLFTELRSLEVGTFSSPRNSPVQHDWYSAISALSSLTHLQRLSIDALDYNSSSPTSPSTNSMPSLTYLRVQCRPSLLADIKLLKQAMKNLHEIRLDLSPRTSGGDADITWDGFTREFTSLCEIWGKLRKLMLTVGDKFSDFPSDGILDDLLNPILQLSELTSLDINFPAHQTTISEGLAFKIIGSYRRLERLNVLFYNFNISHEKLAEIANLCPRLLYLGVGIRLDQITKDDYLPQYPALKHPLRTLSTGHLTPQQQDYHAVARCLLRLFPGLEKIETSVQSGWSTDVLQLMDFGRSAILDDRKRSILQSG